MKTIYGTVLVAALAGLATTASADTASVVEAATVCKAQAASQYAVGEQAARVKFKGIYGGNERRKVRVQVLPAEGKSFLALCEVDARSGAIVGLTPPGRTGRPELASVGAP